MVMVLPRIFIPVNGGRTRMRADVHSGTCDTRSLISPCRDHSHLEALTTYDAVLCASYSTTFYPVCWRGTETNPQVDWISYDGWGMHVPEGYFRFATGPDKFVEELRRLGGEDDVRQWCVLAFLPLHLRKAPTCFLHRPPSAKNIFAVAASRPLSLHVRKIEKSIFLC